MPKVSPQKTETSTQVESRLALLEKQVATLLEREAQRAAEEAARKTVKRARSDANEALLQQIVERIGSDAFTVRELQSVHRIAPHLDALTLGHLLRSAAKNPGSLVVERLRKRERGSALWRILIVAP